MRRLLLVAVVSISAAIIGVGAAWLTARTDLTGRKWWRVVVALPLVMPSYVIALTIISALGPRGLLSDLFGFGFPTRFLIAAMPALLLGLAFGLERVIRSVQVSSPSSCCWRSAWIV